MTAHAWVYVVAGTVLGGAIAYVAVGATRDAARERRERNARLAAREEQLRAGYRAWKGRQK